MMKKPVNLYLVGPMGAGKSTIGKQLAQELKYDFLDTDQEIEKRTGADISWIFDVEGEEGFRKREKNVIFDLTELQNIVLATGGGAVALAESRNRLASRGTVVYLTASVEQQLKRTAKDKRRPLLHQGPDQDQRAFLEQLNIEREQMYMEIADIVVSTDGKTVRAVANQILQKLQEDMHS